MGEEKKEQKTTKELKVLGTAVSLDNGIVPGSIVNRRSCGKCSVPRTPDKVYRPGKVPDRLYLFSPPPVRDEALGMGLEGIE